jgi:hypothetical protein
MMEGYQAIAGNQVRVAFLPAVLFVEPASVFALK